MSSSVGGPASPSDSERSMPESPASSDDDPNNLLDLEAQDDSASESSTGERYGRASYYSWGPSSFPQFAKLPPELRRRVWEMFCPDLTAKARVLNFVMQPKYYVDGHTPVPWSFSDGVELQDTTVSLRLMSAVHRESRDIVIQRYPGTLKIYAEHIKSGIGEIRFNKQRDIVLLKVPDQRDVQGKAHLVVPDYEDGFCEHVEHVALTEPRFIDIIDVLGYDENSSTTTFRNAKTVYLVKQARKFSDRQLTWCGSPMVASARVEMHMREEGYGEDVLFVYCWPEPISIQSCDYVARKVSHFHRKYPDEEEIIREKGVRFAPMFSFEFESGQDLLNEAITRFEMNELGPEDSESGSEDEEEDFEDAESDAGSYESDGIDDAEISETYSSSEDELVPNAVVDGDSEEDGEGEVVAVDEGGVPLGNFSSPEPESADGKAPEDDPSSPIMVARRPKRRIVDSDDDDSGDSEPSRKRARTGDAVVISGDDHDDDVAPRGASQRGQKSRRPRVISSDEESEVDDAPVAPAREESKGSNSSEDASEDDEEDEDEDDQPPRPKSFLANLRRDIAANRAAAPRADESSDESRTVNSDDGEDDEDEEDEDEDGLIDNMAMESDDGSGDEASEGW